MMKKYLLKTAGLAALTLLLHTTGFTQDKNEEEKDTAIDKLREYEEIVIKHKSDKDAKIVLEIKDNKVFINGKPAADYSDDNISVHKKKDILIDGQAFSFSTPDGVDFPGAISIAPSPFRKHSGATSIDGWSTGSSNRAFLGVTTEDPEDGVTGAKIKSISKGSTAFKAGLKEGDIITKVDDKNIEGPDALTEAIHKYKPEDKVALTFKRDGKEQKMTVILGKAPGFNGEVFNMPDMRSFNYDVAPRAYKSYSYAYGVKPRLGIKAQDTEDGKGVKVLEVGDESAAEKAGIKEGDIITRFDGKEVNNATELSELARASKDKPSIKVTIIRDGKTQEVDVRIPRKLKTTDL